MRQPFRLLVTGSRTWDDVPTPTDQKVVPAADRPMRWSPEGYHGHSWTSPQAS